MGTVAHAGQISPMGKHGSLPIGVQWEKGERKEFGLTPPIQSFDS
jgi:hypothetical protein